MRAATLGIAALLAGLLAPLPLGAAPLAENASPAPTGEPSIEDRVAQAIPNPDDTHSGLPEVFEIGLSTETIVIASNFSGARLVVFGVLDNADARVLRQGGYDIVVALEGPRTPLVVREKERVLGFWINRGSERFGRAPASYSLASSRRLTDVAAIPLLRQLSIGIEYLNLGDDPAHPRVTRDEYEDALRRIRSERGLYEQSFGTVEFVSATLFRADLALPANLPVGRHEARAFLFRNGVFLRERNQTLWVVKSGFENSVSNFAASHGVLYGMVAVLLAIVTGWLGRVIFKRD